LGSVNRPPSPIAAKTPRKGTWLFTRVGSWGQMGLFESCAGPAEKSSKKDGGRLDSNEILQGRRQPPHNAVSAAGHEPSWVQVGALRILKAIPQGIRTPDPGRAPKVINVGSRTFCQSRAQQGSSMQHETRSLIFEATKCVGGQAPLPLCRTPCQVDTEQDQKATATPHYWTIAPSIHIGSARNHRRSRAPDKTRKIP
jgi:hypothetical protein